MSHLGRVSFLTAIWVLLWGSPSIANVVGGVLASALLLAAFPDPRVSERRRLPIRPVPAARLAAHVASQLVVSNALLTREIMTRGTNLRSAVVACPLQSSSPRVLTFLTNVLSLGPGTMPVEIQQGPPVIHLHVLYLSDPTEARRTVARLEELAVAAFGADEEVRT